MNITKIKMKLSSLFFGYLAQGITGHDIGRRNAAPISATNLCINECTGVADGWTNYPKSKNGIYTDGELFFN